ncbi:dehydratase [Prevotella denticola DNF00960]|uniref:NAD-dependent epimerase/dehydratase family protein n=1 Tax=Prevotella denticola TaxID=28129 RepID=UPI0002013C42|nr:NAD-dependent epimerase/dehydratase family protein [Prevotella denticola]AEA21732.1 NAD dependent epimerase/dehydratase family protein [Prevotella denticola F0289]KGF38629.1 dehydratase [Prevotella denticola DNF00960]MBW4897990.1 NAD-dependent epimerase/dehydratase family protein [Prevotella denticola]QUB88932.1 NAD-dependent epimerase/dehydratase family protein [Prevotella denticola]
MKVLITGCHGFVGQNLIPYLQKEGHTIYGLGRTGDYIWDDLDKDKLPDIDAIIHLAGKAHDTKNQTEREVYFKINRDLTIKVFDYFVNHPKIKKLIFFSSVKAAADRVSGYSLTEKMEMTPKGPYGESKAEAEKYINERWNNFPLDKTQGRHIYILRPCMMHGPGNKGNLNLLYKVINAGFPWPLGAFENKRSFCSILNVCFIVGQLLTQNVSGGTFNLADDEILSTNDLIREIGKSLGKSIYIWKFGHTIILFLAKVGDSLHLPLTTERLAKLTENYIVDNRKIKKVLKIDKMPISAREGLSYTIKSFKKKN